MLKNGFLSRSRVFPGEIGEANRGKGIQNYEELNVLPWIPFPSGLAALGRE
ncbi:hypothetical protein CHELA40_13619 [Chelatococcus asaccharovorans]|nr:hypothetical protein CHELA40_13619 [Chelatococcus asaccharovorans]CAH1676777.1 hypothetical protein CHELA17_62004 [Chelatococcus asaccharovorans]